MAIDVVTFLAPASFKDLVGRLIDELKSSSQMEGSAGIFMPGEMEYPFFFFAFSAAVRSDKNRADKSRA